MPFSMGWMDGWWETQSAVSLQYYQHVWESDSASMEACGMLENTISQ